MTNRKLAHTAPFGLLPTAGGGMARAAYSAALKARLDIDPLLKSSGLTAVQLKNLDSELPSKTKLSLSTRLRVPCRTIFSVSISHKRWICANSGSSITSWPPPRLWVTRWRA